MSDRARGKRRSAVALWLLDDGKLEIAEDFGPRRGKAQQQSVERRIARIEERLRRIEDALIDEGIL